MKTVDEVFICECLNTEHQIIMSYDNDFDTVWCSIHLIPESNIFKRIWKGIKYIFGYRSRYGHFDEFIFRKQAADKLQDIVKVLKG